MEVNIFFKIGDFLEVEIHCFALEKTRTFIINLGFINDSIAKPQERDVSYRHLNISFIGV